jgi:hypothetical protein
MDRGNVTLLVTLAQVGHGQLLGGVLGLVRSLEQGRKASVQFQQALAVLYPADRRIAPCRALRAELVSTLKGQQGLSEVALLPQRVPQVAVGFGILGIEFEDLGVEGDGPLEVALGSQRIAEVAVGLGVLGVELEGLAVAGHGLPFLG